MTDDPNAFGIVAGQTEFSYWFEWLDTATCLFSKSETYLLVRGSAEFVTTLFDRLVDVFLSKLVTSSPSDVMLVHPNGPETVLLAEITLSDEGKWIAILTEHKRVGDLQDYFTLSDESEQRLAVEQSFAHYCEWVRPANASVRVDSQAKGHLILKVDPNELWFLKFPIAMFCHLGLGVFSKYENVQTIVTDRTVTQVTLTSTKVETELADTEKFLTGAYVILNTYQTHLRAFPELRDFTDFVIEIMRAFGDVAFDTSRQSLRWSLNPDSDELREIFLSPTTRFVFANFEADEGVWELGDGPHACWRSVIQHCNQHVESHTTREFPLLQLAGRLGHISLLRVFHCNSIYDPYKASSPADTGTLARDVLLTGAWFVEGSFTKERYLDYICLLLRLLLGSSDLQVVLKAKSRLKQADFFAWVDRANDILKTRNYELISH